MCSSEWTRRNLLRSAVAGAALASVPAVLAAPGRAVAATDATDGGAPQRTALTNVRVFDGRTLSAPRTVVVDGPAIGLNPLGARIVDGQGATLLPGLIDAHVHLQDVTTLQQLTGYGVTTALDMACWPASLVDSLRHRTGLTDIRSAGTPAVGPESLQAHLPGFPPSGIISSPDQAVAFVAARLAEGSDHIKVIVDVPGLDRATLTALTRAAHAVGKLVNGHAVTGAAAEEALYAGIDVIHHVPLDTALTTAQACRYAAGGRTAVPTLTMMEGFAALGIPGLNYDAARDSVTALHRAGVRILAGTDSNHTPGVPVHPAFGAGLHHELELLVDAGLSPAEALRAATVQPAQAFGLTDRGTIAPGRRADLVLVDGDPLADITTTRNILRVWAGGVEHDLTN